MALFERNAALQRSRGLKIEVLDHVIIGRRTTDRQKDYVSLRELGYFY
jgi:DNA repair protein RadC